MEVKEQIILGAGELFGRYGIKSITMDDIARHLGMSKKTIYQFFEDKTQLVDAGLDGFLIMQKREMEGLREKAGSVLEELAMTGDYLREKVCNINPSLVYDMKKYYPLTYKRLIEFKRSFVENFIIEVLERGRQEGIFRANIDPKILARLRVEQTEMGFNPDVFGTAEFDNSEVQIALFEHFMYGILTLRGHEELNKKWGYKD